MLLRKGVRNRFCGPAPFLPRFSRKTVPDTFSTGYTLVEILVATTLTLILMTATVQVFSGVGNGITSSRRALEAFNRLRAAEANLRMDLQGSPPR